VGVAARYRGRGLGKALLTQALRDAEEHGFVSVICAVDARNRSAMSLYAQLGFRGIAERDIFWRAMKPLRSAKPKSFPYPE
jgi:ribosomal protein S18 acetylase RimI-like enzyme